MNNATLQSTTAQRFAASFFGERILQWALILGMAIGFWSLSGSPWMALVWLLSASIGFSLDPNRIRAYTLLTLPVALVMAVWAATRDASFPTFYIKPRLDELSLIVPHTLRPLGVGMFFTLVPTVMVGGLLFAIAKRSWRMGCAVLVGVAASFGGLLSIAGNREQGIRHVTYPWPLKIDECFLQEKVPTDLSDVVFVPRHLPTPEFDVKRGVAYGPHGFRNTLDLYIPKSVSKTPVVVYLHGGGVGSGGTDGTGNGLPDAWRDALLSRGLAVAEVNYRLAWAVEDSQHDEVTGCYPAQIQDTLAAIRFLRTQSNSLGIDGARIGAVGHSFGGTLASLAGLASNVPEFLTDSNRDISSSVQAVVNSSGITDHRVWAIHCRLYYEMLNLPGSENTASESVYTKYFLKDHFQGRTFDPNDPVLLQFSPLSHVRPDSPPFLHMYGMRDCAAPPIQGDIFHARLKKAGVQSKLILIPGAHHGLADVSGTGEVMAAFLANALSIR